ncbi:Uncharacterized protein OS=Candidatus Methylomirabilis oxyfera GN=DAMO_2872 PE=4 SV=1 [Gemmata massiliana]|uniref:HNH endonuclease n=1 Tax=Gemmata massiliana TaxID=1210884 RepID=A0A6P2CTG0_9BACT|nr:hypothetical protein [Gemmata massiliana]VTR91847.1 Uncharacterized protein OS=Candidatus Methylomirabilis oxyfera GN=DAMO_2872 PE=4 SV=1 [Gemmata massiliana]
MKRDDDFPAATKRLLAARAGHVCSCPECMAPTSGPALNDAQPVNLGDAAHITAASPKGPRYDATLSPDQRSDADNGIWLCKIHAAVVDRDETRYPVNLLRAWKEEAERRALKVLGKPTSCATGNIAIASPSVRLGAETCVMVGNERIAHTTIFNATDPHERMTMFIGAFVIQFSLLKRQERSNAIVEHFVATVHETQPIPQYRPLMMVYPATTNLYYIEIDKNPDGLPREFRPLQYYTHTPDGSSEQRFPAPLVLDDNLPAHIAIRLNAKTAGMYIVSISAVVSSGTDREVLVVMPPQRVIFEKFAEPEEGQ